MSMTGYRLGEGVIEHMDRVAVPHKMSGAEISIRKYFVPVFPAAGDHEDRHLKTVPLLRLRPSSGLLRVVSPSRRRSVHTLLAIK
jgi:hypothetical protein